MSTKHQNITIQETNNGWNVLRNLYFVELIADFWKAKQAA